MSRKHKLCNTNNTLKDPDKWKLLERHMGISHILGERDQDEDVVIRMTENNRNWILLDHTRQVLDQITRISNAMQNAFMRNDNETFDKLQKEFNRSIAEYSNWVMKNSRYLTGKYSNITPFWRLSE